MIQIILAVVLMSGLPVKAQDHLSGNQNNYNMTTSAKNREEVATLGAGCFWCVEAIFQELKGVNRVVSGYSGGHITDPSYAEVCTGNTGHAEVCQIFFNPEIISYSDLLEVFWRTHDPTTLNRQGADVGTQYRSVVFFHNQEQQRIAEKSKKETDQSGLYSSPIVTEITEFEQFYTAEGYHQDYFSQNPNQPYCSFTIDPKVKKFKKQFMEIIK